MSTSGRRAPRLHALISRGSRGPACARTGVGVASVLAASLAFAGAAQAAAAPVTLGTDSNFSVLAYSTITNTGPTTMAKDYGLSPGTSVTGAPVTLGTPHVADPVAVQAQNDLTTAITDAAGRPATPLPSSELSGQAFTPGVYSADSLLFSAGSMTLNAQGDPNAVFIFQIGSSMTTGSATHVLLVNGAQPCNVFWEAGASVTLGSGSTFVGTVLAHTTITAGTAATLDGRLLAETGAVNLDTNTITTSACSTTPPGSGGTPTGGTPTSGGTPTTGGTTTSGTPTTGGTPTSGTPAPGGTRTPTPVGSSNTSDKKKLATQRRARHQAAVRKANHLRRLRAQARRRQLARRRLALARARQHHSPARVPVGSGGFTG